MPGLPLIFPVNNRWPPTEVLFKGLPPEGLPGEGSEEGSAEPSP